MNRIRVISDLHWGHKASLVKTAESLCPLSENVDLLIFNGDSVEQKYNHSPKRKATPLPTIEDLRTAIANCGCRSLFLSGNHDPNVSETHFLELNDILITHGDGSFDSVAPWSQQAKELEAHVNKVNGAAHPETLREYLANHKKATIETQHHSSDYDPTSWGKIQIFFRAAWPPTRAFRILSCWRKMPGATIARLKQFGYSPRIVLVGHTHKPEIVTHSEATVINTGSFFPWPGAFAVDITEESIEVFAIRKRRNAFSIGKRISEIRHPATFDRQAISQLLEAANRDGPSRPAQSAVSASARKVSA